MKQIHLSILNDTVVADQKLHAYPAGHKLYYLKRVNGMYAALSIDLYNF